MKTSERIENLLGDGIEETLDPELKRAFEFDDNQVAPELKKSENVRLLPDKFRVSGDGVFYTIQGEGMTMGMPCVFLRLHVCNLQCVWCFPAGTKIKTPQGDISIENINEGDTVLSYRNKKITASLVNKVLTQNTKDFVRVVTEKGDIICTSQHNFYVNKRKSSSGKYWKLPASALKGKYVKYDDIDFTVVPMTGEQKLGYLKGAYLGDGYSNGSDRLQFSVCDYDFIEVLHDIVNTLGANCNILHEKRLTASGKQVYRISTSRSNIVNIALSAVENKEQAAGFIAGFYDAEGHLGRNYITMSQADEQILERVRILLHDYFDIQSSETYEGDKAYSFQINGKENIRKFFENIPVQIERKIYNDNRRILEDVYVLDVIPFQKETKVYNLETTLGSYFANNYLVGNCDAWYTWNPKTPEFWTESKLWTVEEAADKVKNAWKAENPAVQKRLIITGGEPLLQQKNIVNLMNLLGKEWVIEIETNGTILPHPHLLLNCQFNCSPKLRNSKNHDLARRKKEVIQLLSKANTLFKFVVMHNEDLDEIEKEWVQEFGIPVGKVCLMPQGVTAEEVRKNAQRVVEYAKIKGYRLLGRLQNEIWGARRKV